MEEVFKNSLTGQLEELGILSDIETNANPLAIQITDTDIEHSPFANLNAPVQDPIQEQKEGAKKVVQKRLNDYDFNILQDSAFVDIEDCELSREEKIEKIEKLIKETENKLFLIEGRNSKLKEKLTADKKALLLVLDKLKQGKTTVKQNLTRNLNLRTSRAIDRLKTHLPSQNALFAIVSKFFPKIYKGYLMKRAVNKLSALNKTANELLDKKIPYGESDQRYDALIEYLSSANTIHAKLIKKI